MQSAALQKDIYGNLLETKKHQLDSDGYVVLSEDELPMSKQDWTFIEDELASVDFEFLDDTESGEKGKTHIFRVKMSGIPDIHLQGLWDYFNGTKTQDYIHYLTGRDDIFIDRCQAHRYEDGGFIAHHIDTARHPKYTYSLIILLNDDYEGGEINFFTDPDQPLVLKPKARSIILFKSTIPHSVNKVTSGIRSTICNFYTV